MFTGIIESQGKVLSLEPKGESLEVWVGSTFSDITLGESIAINGVCVTVSRFSNGEILFFLSPETIEKTNLGFVRPGTILNLERALTLQTRLSGHWVQGHVDGKAKFIEKAEKSNAYLMTFEIPRYLSKYCVEKCSVAINGVSLTVNTVLEKDGEVLIGITVIPYTWYHTNLSSLSPGDWVNIEADILAKYVERLCHH